MSDLALVPRLELRIACLHPLPFITCAIDIICKEVCLRALVGHELQS